ncbi:MAG: haloacid dehalogenase type II [Acidobacteriaceae bacterium]
MLDLIQYDSLSFDCYGTLIDWESGLLKAFAALLQRPAKELDKRDLFSRFAKVEAEIESGAYVKYREVLRSVAARIASDLNVSISPDALDAFAQSIRDWEPFADTVPALEKLAARYRLYILSNVDDDLFAFTAAKLKVRFAQVITAEQVGSYKPDPRNFERLLQVVGGRERHIHVAESLYHDHAPAQRMGIRSIWIHRNREPGATQRVDARFDLELPDLKSLADLAESIRQC